MSIIVQISRFFNEYFTTIWYLAIFLGAWTLLSQIYRFINFIYRKIIRKRKNLSQIYKKGTWAFITGSSEGIGKAFAFALAKENFNIILSARTESKLKTTKQQLQKKYPHIQVKYIVVDFAAKPDKQDFQKEWYRTNELDKLDISIVVNNAGIDYLNLFTDIKLETLIKLINLDCFFLNSMHYLFLERFLNESRKSGNKQRKLIINVSSLCAEIPVSYFSAYNACKIYVDRLTLASALQYPQVDFMSLRPSQVSTRMTAFKEDILTVSTQKCVEPLLDDIGYQNVSHGHALHAIQAYLYSIVPNFLFQWGWQKIFLPQFIKARNNISSTQ